MPQSHQLEQNKMPFRPDRAKHLRQLAFLLDNSIPIPFTRYRMGIDPILGLLGIVGGTGDIIGGVLGAYIVVQAARMGVEPKVIGQMLGNLLLDLGMGLLPGLGDVLDVAWKANAQNVALLDQYFEMTPTPRKNSPLFVFGVIVLLTVMVIGFASIVWMVLRAIASVIS